MPVKSSLLLLMNNKWSFWYWLMKQLVGLCLRIFFRKIQVVGKEHIPKNKPLMLGVNHPNAFMDALLVAVFYPYQTWFLARSDVFNNGFSKRLFTSFKMMPIYRTRDKIKANIIEKNKDVFEDCYSILKQSGSIIIFPEGSHNKKHFLRPFKKGMLRIAFGAEEKNDYNLDVEVLPVFVHYEAATKFRKNVLLVFGKPLSLRPYYKNYKENPNKTLTEVNHLAFNHHSQYTLNLPDDEFYEDCNFLREIYNYNHLKLKEKSLYKQLQADQRLMTGLKKKRETELDIIKQLLYKVRKYKEDLNKYQLKDEMLDNTKLSENKSGFLADVLYLVFTFPIYLIGLIHHIIPYKLSNYLTLRLFKDSHFFASMKMVFGLFLFPLFYVLFFVLSYRLSGSFLAALLYIVLLPLSGFWAHRYYISFRKLIGRLNFLRLGKEEKATLLEKRQSIIRDVGLFYSHKK